MRELTLAEIREIELGIMDEIDRYATINGLSYYLSYGTLIGAIRHNGFIPWDDDIDVFMPREDYERFRIEFNEQRHEQYKVICADNIEQYPNAFLKVVDTRTVLVENYIRPFSCGVFIDVFPLDSVGANLREIGRLDSKLRIYRTALTFKRLGEPTTNGFIGKLKFIAEKAITFSVSQKWLIKKIDKKAQSLSAPNSLYTAPMVLMLYGYREIYKSSWWNSGYTYFAFEDHYYRVPNEYQHILTAIYGDYMILPPMRERVPKHCFTAWWREYPSTGYKQTDIQDNMKFYATPFE